MCKEKPADTGSTLFAHTSPSAEPVSYWQAPIITGRRAASQLPDTVDVAVVGGGLLGAAAAYWLARTGAATLLLERGILAEGATGRNGGFMVAGTAERYPAAIARLGHATAREIWRLTLDNRALLRQTLIEERISCDYREPGHLQLALGGHQLAELSATVTALRADGFQADLLDRDQAQQMIGTPLAGDVTGGLFAAKDGLLQPARLVHGLASAAQRQGARIITGTALTELQLQAGGLLIQTARGQLRAKAAVIATNAWLGQFVPVLRRLVTPVRGQALAFEPILRVFDAGMGAAITSTGEYWQQTPEGAIVIGGCRAAAHEFDVGVQESTPTPEVQAQIEHVLPRLFPELADLRVTRRWAGLMAFTGDYLPLADRAPGLPGVWVVGGFCGHGMPFGLRLGQLLAQAATSGARPAELEPFQLDRPTLSSGAR
jgi:glycine/D-amino acid oxidase-like deaminating enzyme